VSDLCMFTISRDRNHNTLTDCGRPVLNKVSLGVSLSISRGAFLTRELHKTTAFFMLSGMQIQ